MKKTIAVLSLIAAMMVPAVSMAAGGDFQSYANTYPMSQSNNTHVNTAE